MTLRKSFLARLYENSKRRLWLIVMAALLCVVAFPLFTSMGIAIVEATEENLGRVKMLENLYKSMTELFALNGGILFFVGCFAVLAGIQGFSYLYDRSKIDFYYSKPVKASSRFCTIWLNGFLIFVIPYVLGSCINLLLAAASGVMDMALFLTWVEGIVLTTGFYLSIYSIVILAVMLTGKLLITIMGIAVFLLYEMAIRGLIYWMYSFSFHFFYEHSETDWYVPWLSPFKAMSMYWDGKIGVACTFLWFVLFAAVILAVAYWCYKKRPAELAGSAMTFQGIKPFIKIGIAVPVALVAGLATAGIMEYEPLDGEGSPFFPIILGVLFLLLACGEIQVIYEADIKAMFRKKRDIVISAVLTLIIVLIFRFDLLGYDSRMPKMSEIESVSIVTANDSRYSAIFYDENMKQLTKEEYADKYMRLTGEDAENVRELALLSIDKYKQYPNRKAFNEANDESAGVRYKFRLKNGRVVAREIRLNLRDEENMAAIAKIENSEEFIRYNEAGMSEWFVNAVESGEYTVEATWGNDMNEEDLTRAQAAEILRLYREDLLQSSYEVKSKELPVGEIVISLNRQVTYERSITLSVYPSYKNTMDYLKANGFETEEYVNIEEIDRITISKFYTAKNPKIKEEDLNGFSEAVETAVEAKTCTVDFTDRDDIQAIIESAYPESLDWDYWYMGSPYEDTEYGITVYFKTDSEYYEEYGAVGNFNFLKDQVPDFVSEKLPREMPME